MGQAHEDTVTIRRATFDDLSTRVAYALWRLRSEVFVVEQACAYLDLDGRDLEPGTVHIWAEADGTVVGALRVMTEADGWRIGRVVVAADHRSAGLGARLMREALTLVGAEPCVLDAQAHLERWYAAFGFAATGPQFVEDGIPHVPMALPRP